MDSRDYLVPIGAAVVVWLWILLVIVLSVS
jgi:hypothetical protein